MKCCSVNRTYSSCETKCKHKSYLRTEPLMQWLAKTHKGHAPESMHCLAGLAAALRVQWHRFGAGCSPLPVPSTPTCSSMLALKEVSHVARSQGVSRVSSLWALPQATNREEGIKAKYVATFSNCTLQMRCKARWAQGTCCIQQMHVSAHHPLLLSSSSV